jgi:hypothetical protein
MFVVEDMNRHNRQYTLLLLLYVCEKNTSSITF